MIGGIGDVSKVQSEIDVEGADVWFGGVAKQQTRDGSSNHDDVIPEFSEDLHELDEDVPNGLKCLCVVVVPCRHHCGLNFWSRIAIAASSPRPLDSIRSRYSWTSLTTRSWPIVRAP